MNVKVNDGYARDQNDDWIDFNVINIDVFKDKAAMDAAAEAASDDTSDDDDEDSDETPIDWKDHLEVKYEYDTHYGCYCKTQQVCGCGCDPLHDGW